MQSKEGEFGKCVKLDNMQYNDIYYIHNAGKKINPDINFYEKKYPERIKEITRASKVFTKVILNAIEDVRFKYDDKFNILVYPFGRFKHICHVVEDYYNILTFGNFFDRDGIKNLKCHYDIKVSKLLYKGFSKKDVNFAIDAVRYLCNVFHKNGIKLAIIGNDTTFKERAIVVACHELGIPVVVMQHGLFTQTDIRLIPPGKFADAFWCWSKFIKDEYDSCHNVSPDFVRLLGYPHRINDCNISHSKTVLFASTPYFEVYDTVFLDYINIIKTVYKACESLGLKMVLRLHPGEERRIYIQHIKHMENLTFSETPDLMEELSKCDLVIGDMSTVLLEAGLAYRKAIQILWNKRIMEIAEDPVFTPVVKVENDFDSIVSAISSNIGIYDKSPLVDYYAGEREGFDNRLLKEISKWVENESYSH